MNKFIIALGIFLVSASAVAHHTAGLKNFQAGQANGATGSSVSITGGSVIAPSFVVAAARFSIGGNAVTDPISCAKKWGEHCTTTTLPAFGAEPLELGDTDTYDHIDLRGTSPNGLTWRNQRLMKEAAEIKAAREAAEALDLTIGNEIDLNIGDTSAGDLSIGAPIE